MSNLQKIRGDVEYPSFFSIFARLDDTVVFGNFSTYISKRDVSILQVNNGFFWQEKTRRRHICISPEKTKLFSRRIEVLGLPTYLPTYLPTAMQLGLKTCLSPRRQGQGQGQGQEQEKKKRKKENWTKRLRHAPDQQRRDALLLAPDRNLRRDAALGRKGHLDERGDFAPGQGLAVEFEGVGAGGEGDVGAVEGLEGEGFGELVGGV